MAESSSDKTWAQDVFRCESCRRGPVKLYCTFCPAKLCTNCSSDHILSDQLNRHEIIAFKNRETATAQSELQVDCPCQECKDKERTKHNMENISDALRSKIDRLQKEAEMIKSQKMPEIVRLWKEIQNKIDEIQATYELRVNEVILQGKQWHSAVDNLVQEYEDELLTMKESDLREFQRQQEKFETLLTKAKRKLKIHESTDISQMENFCFPDMVFPDPILWTGPNFVPINVTKETIQHLFGTLTHSSVKFYTTQQSASTTPQRQLTLGFRMQKYRPAHEICRCAHPQILRSFSSGESKCAQCKKFIK
ncbi:uncharacterized protein LOC133194496 [Saccostrea echinata]|uniref:uncharacterized protein LOC133194496 n=1 Tax=Saccostrea echinata TaxID=191078 RepID=UPI002A80CB61|nr:uncharacterized protein LOC133194496 [Saccostrea echinata]